jgi:hypothetical protein
MLQQLPFRGELRDFEAVPVRIVHAEQQVADAAAVHRANLDAVRVQVGARRFDVVGFQPEMIEVVAVGQDLRGIGEEVDHLALVHLHDDHLQIPIGPPQLVRFLVTEEIFIERSGPCDIPDPKSDVIKRGKMKVTAGGVGGERVAPTDGDQQGIGVSWPSTRMERGSACQPFPGLTHRPSLDSKLHASMTAHHFSPPHLKCEEPSAAQSQPMEMDSSTQSS